jgi:hypothetical protein
LRRITVIAVADAPPCTITRGSGNDVIRGTRGDNVICAGAGNDVVYGGGGNDIIRAGSGNDVVYGRGGNDTIRGGSGNDVLRGGEGNDRLAGGPGRDTLYGNGGADSLDTQDARRGNDVARGGAGAPTRARPIPATFVAPAEALGAWVANATGRGIIAVGGESRGHGADRRSDGRFASVGLPPASGAPLRRSACRQNPRPPARCSLSRLWAQLRRH